MDERDDREDRDELLDALDRLVAVLHDNARRDEMTVARADMIRRLRHEGLSYREVLAREPSPLIVELTKTNLQALIEAGGRIRRAGARALYEEGMTMEEIAALLGVTRQRVSALLREGRES